MFPLLLMAPLALVSLDLVVPWPSASDGGLLPVPVPSGWASEAVRSRRLSPSDNRTISGSRSRRLHKHKLDEETEDKRTSDKEGLGDEETEGPGDEDTGSGTEGPGDEETEDSMSLTSLVVWQGFPLLAWGLIIGYWVGGLIFSCQYKTKVVDKRPHLEDGAAPIAPDGDFATGAFSCFEDPPTLMHAWCCLFCRAGDTYQAAGIERYWTVIMLFMLAIVVSVAIQALLSLILSAMTGENLGTGWVVMDWLVSSFIIGGIGGRARRKLRMALGGSEEGGPQLGMDVLLFGFCTYCAVAQEARAVDAATGVRVDCCCQLTDGLSQPLDDKPLIGQPVDETVA